MKRCQNIITLLLLLVFVYQCKKPENIVKVVTLDALPQDIAYKNVSVKGEIIHIGYTHVDDHGILLSTEPYPEFGNSITKSLGKKDSAGIFTAAYDNLTPSTEYYFKAYANLGKNTYYGDRKSFSTRDGSELIIITTTEASNLDHTTADIGGNITDDGGYAIIDRGVCWNTSGNPLITDNSLSEGSGSGSFALTITDLSPTTEYHARAYATNMFGPNYGNEVSFSTTSQGYNAWFPFNNNVEDESGNEAHATNYGALFTHDRFGNANSALLFDNSYVDSNGPLLGGSNFTLNLWIYPDSLAGNIFGQFNSSSTNSLYCAIDNSTGHLFIDHSESVGNDLVSTNPIETKSWYMISLVWGDDIKLYINGVLNDTEADPEGISSANNFLIGIHTTQFGLSEGFKGIIDDVGVYDYALNGSEISNLYHENDWSGKL